jgi:arylformamidase
MSQEDQKHDYEIDRSRIIDISLAVQPGMPVFPGNPRVALDLQQSMEAGDEADVSSLSLGVHTGTHVDAPSHFLQGSSATNEIVLDTMMGKAHVLDATSISGHAGAAALRSLPIPDDCTRLLVKTRNSELWSKQDFSSDFQGLTADGAAYLVERGIALIGWDYLSIGPFGDATETHRVLLDAGVVILEGIDLRGVEAGGYELICLPLLLKGSDGAPARAVLRPGD